MTVISDICIDISYSDIGTKYVGLNPLIPISKEFRYRHQLPLRYQTKSISDIPIFQIEKSFPYEPSKILLAIFDSDGFGPTIFRLSIGHFTTALWEYTQTCLCRISDIGQNFIPISDIMSDSAHFSPLSDVPISGSVWYRWSRISDWVPTYGYYTTEILWHMYIQKNNISLWIWVKNRRAP
jgi:hypothetical protein